MQLPDEIPSCIHEDEKSYRRYSEGSRNITEVYCNDCGALLYEKDIDLVRVKVTRHIYDEVYYFYYTREGRTKLAIETLKLKGWPIPDLWRNNE